MIVYVSTNTPSIQAVFSSPLARYLGRISFGLYLVHLNVVHIFAIRLLPLLWYWLDIDDCLHPKDFVFLLFQLFIYTPICLVLAHVFTKLVDENTIKLAKWVENQVLISDADDDNQRMPQPEATLMALFK